MDHGSRVAKVGPTQAPARVLPQTNKRFISGLVRGAISVTASTQPERAERKSGYFFRVTNDGNAYSFSLGQTPEVLDQGRELTSHLSLNSLLTALRTYPGRNGFDHDQLPLEPKVLIDSRFFHLLTADVAFSIIVT